MSIVVNVPGSTAAAAAAATTSNQYGYVVTAGQHRQAKMGGNTPNETREAIFGWFEAQQNVPLFDYLRTPAGVGPSASASASTSAPDSTSTSTSAPAPLLPRYGPGMKELATHPELKANRCSLVYASTFRCAKTVRLLCGREFQSFLASTVDWISVYMYFFPVTLSQIQMNDLVPDLLSTLTAHTSTRTHNEIQIMKNYAGKALGTFFKTLRPAFDAFNCTSHPVENIGTDLEVSDYRVIIALCPLKYFHAAYLLQELTDARGSDVIRCCLGIDKQFTYEGVSVDTQTSSGRGVVLSSLVFSNLHKQNTK